MSVATTLTGAVAPTDSTISVADGSISKPEEFGIAINGEMMTVTGGFGTNTWTVLRDEQQQSAVVASDDFARVEVDSWGHNAAGQIWDNAISASSRVFSVAGGAGIIEDSNVTGVRVAWRIPTVPVQLNAEVTLRFILDKEADTADDDLEIRIRELDNATRDRYMIRLNIDPGTNDITWRIMRRVNGVDNNISSLVTDAGGFAVDEWFVIRLQAYGSNPTTLNAKVWKEIDGEPGAWDATGTDSTAIMQVPAYPALSWALGAGATNAPVTIGFSDWRYLRIPTGSSHASGSAVVILEPWELPIAVNSEAGIPDTAPPSGALQVQTDVSPPTLWVRVGTDWLPVRVDEAPAFVSSDKWNYD